jgi:hypothetical protein
VGRLVRSNALFLAGLLPGNGIGLAVPRTFTILDATVWLSLANIALLVWFVRQAPPRRAPACINRLYMSPRRYPPSTGIVVPVM